MHSFYIKGTLFFDLAISLFFCTKEFEKFFHQFFQNVNYNGNLLPHLPGGGSHNGSPDMRLAASNLSLGSNMGGKNKGLPIIVLKSIINKKLLMLAKFTCPDCPLHVTLIFFSISIQ